MAAPTDLAPSITNNAQSPNSATADGVTVTQNPPSEQIQADKYLLAKATNANPPAGVRFFAINSPGAQ